MKARLATSILLAAGLTAPFAATAIADTALENPAVREILAMTEAGVGEAVILARIAQIDSWPELTGEEIAALKKKKVGDRVLLRLVERAGAAPETRPEPRSEPEPEPSQRSEPAPAPAPVPAPPPAEPDGATAATAAETPPRLRVELTTDFPVHWVEVRVDGRRVAELGELLSGESEPAGILSPPVRLRFRDSRVVYEGDVKPGERRVEVSYAVTEVEADPDDEWSEYSRQSYASAGVWASGKRPEGRWTAAKSAKCVARAEQTCHVIAKTSRKAKTRFGGDPVYGLSYRVSPEPQP